MVPRTRIALAVTAASALAAAAAARADTDPAVTPFGPYVGVGWGQFDLRLDNLNDVGTAVNSVTHSSDDAFKVTFGCRVSRYFALEGDYMAPCRARQAEGPHREVRTGAAAALQQSADLWLKRNRQALASVP